MEVEFQVSKEDYVDFFKTQLKENFQKRIPLVAVILFFAVGSVSTSNFDLLTIVIVIIGYTILLSLLFYFLPFLIFSKQLKKLIATDPGYSERRKWTIQDDGLKSEGESTTSIRNWESIIKVNANRKYISLTLVDKRFMMVPKSSFGSDTEATNFLGLIQNKIFKAQGLSNLTIDASGIYKKDKPPYLLGLLGFIPLVGAIIGVALILYGLIKYKDKLLVFIGAAGIAFSVIFYGSLFYFGERTNVFKTGFAKLDKRLLNDIVKEIEFYKMQKGAYPDSLEQLNTKDQITTINDPLISEKKNSKFNYRHIGNKYTLFSSGIDEKPNTKDDIYPTLIIDTNKTGLIILRKQ